MFVMAATSETPTNSPAHPQFGHWAGRSCSRTKKKEEVKPRTWAATREEQRPSPDRLSRLHTWGAGVGFRAIGFDGWLSGVGVTEPKYAANCMVILLFGSVCSISAHTVGDPRGSKGTKELGLFLVWWGICQLTFFDFVYFRENSIDLLIIWQFTNFKSTFMAICHV
jgi:hypothetical protein